MKVTPIIMSGAMARALIEARKSQTRRAMKPQPVLHDNANGGHWTWKECAWTAQAPHCPLGDFNIPIDYCPYGKAGDLLYVRESVWVYKATANPSFILPRYPADVHDGAHPLPMNNGDFIALAPTKKTPSIHMPRVLSRITLELTDVRIERLQDISDEDSLAEGINRIAHGDGGTFYHFERSHPHPWNWTSPDFAFQELWESINGRGSWDLNHWVWVIQFAVHQTNIDTFLKTREAAA